MAANIPPQTNTVQTKTTVSIPSANIEAVSKNPVEKNKYGVTSNFIRNVRDNAKDKLESKGNQHSVIEIDMENLISAWQKKSEDIAANRPFLKSSLADSTIRFESNTILIKSTQVAYEHLKTMRMDLLSYFKQVYHNDEINVLTEEKKASATDTGTQKMSMKEVFEKMSAKNPILKQLKDKLGMDFEY